MSFQRESDEPNVLCQVFNTGQARHFKRAQDESVREELGDYMTMNQKLHQVVRNVLFIPIKLGNHAIGVFEVANKKGNQDFTSNDFTLLSQVADEIASGLISHEMKYNIKKEHDEQVKYFKGLMNQAYHTFLVPMVTELSQSVSNILKADK